MLRVGSFDVSREFRHLSGVPMPHNNTITQLPLAQCKSYRTCPVCVRYGKGYKTTCFSKGAINTPKPPPLEAVDAADSADTHTRF